MSFYRFVCVFLAIGFTAFFTLTAQAKTRIYVGSQPSLCTSMQPLQCKELGQINGKHQSLFTLDKNALSELENSWPFDSDKLKHALLKRLKERATQTQQLDEQGLSAVLSSVSKNQQSTFTQQELRYIVSALEAYQGSEKGRLKEKVDIKASGAAINDILALIKSAIHVGINEPSKSDILLISAGQADPYRASDYYLQMLQQAGIEAQWLALTPALVTAMNTDQCAQLASLRTHFHGPGRARVYPDKTNAEQALCQQGEQALLARLQSAHAVILSDGELDLWLNSIYQNNNTAYRWRDELSTRPALVTFGRSSRLFAGSHQNAFILDESDALAALTQGTQKRARPCENKSCKNAQLTYSQGLSMGTTPFNALDTLVSEKDRQVRLAIAAANNQVAQVYGLDKDTALLLIDSGQSKVGTVIGSGGVSRIAPIAKNQFEFTYLPAGTNVQWQNNQLEAMNLQPYLVKNTLSQSLASMRLDNIISGQRFQSVTQAMCLSGAKHVSGTQNTTTQRWQFDFNVTDKTRFMNTDVSSNRCAIENLQVSYSSP